jgi:DNA-binding transcriptional regulator YiaG
MKINTPKDQLTDAKGNFESVVNHHPKNTVVISPPDEFHPFIGQTGNYLLAKVFTPKGQEIRQMLLELRKQLGWSRGFAAAVIGVSESSIEKWERGRRKPIGASRKMIWFLHSKCLQKDNKIRNAWDLATWGQCPHTDEILAELGILSATQFISEEALHSILHQHESKAANTPS